MTVFLAESCVLETCDWSGSSENAALVSTTVTPHSRGFCALVAKWEILLSVSIKDRSEAASAAGILPFNRPCPLLSGGWAGRGRQQGGVDGELYFLSHHGVWGSGCGGVVTVAAVMISEYN